MLGDFGLSKRLLDTLDMAHTPLGTPFYMAPEVMEGKAYSFKGDVWAMGCLLYELCCLQPAFRGADFPQVAMKVLAGDFEPICPTYSAELRSFIGSMFSKLVSQRPSVEDLMMHPQIQTRTWQHIRQVQAKEAAQGKGAAGLKGNWSATWKARLPILLSAAGALSEKNEVPSNINLEDKEHFKRKSLQQEEAEAEVEKANSHSSVSLDSPSRAPSLSTSPPRSDLYRYSNYSNYEEDCNTLMSTCPTLKFHLSEDSAQLEDDVEDPEGHAVFKNLSRGKTLLEKFTAGELDEDSAPNMDTVPVEVSTADRAYSSGRHNSSHHSSGKFEAWTERMLGEGAWSGSNSMDEDDMLLMSTQKSGLLRGQLSAILRSSLRDSVSPSPLLDQHRLAEIEEARAVVLGSFSTVASSSASSAYSLPLHQPSHTLEEDLEGTHATLPGLQDSLMHQSSWQMTQRAGRIRDRCQEQLGDLFQPAYDFLKARCALSLEDNIEDDLVLKIELEELLGEGFIKYWPLMDELIYLESL
mmetsp:Transcript_16870/g.23299  ORF Transcript_16870/g.23299 Transcript_16870/m.23299 type:complete len:524 (+) Transcript_16870:787-2358(+)